MNQITNLSLQSIRSLALHSGCQLCFIKKISKINNNIEIIPVLMLTGIEATGPDYNRVWDPMAEGHIGIIDAGYDNENHTTYINITGPDGNDPIPIQTTDWLFINLQTLEQNDYKIIYPRAFINSLGVKVSNELLVLKYYNIEQQGINISDFLVPLEQYNDYSILTRSLQEEYALTLNNDLIIKNNYIIKNNQISFLDRPLRLNYTISNADVAIYLDALLVSKLNAYPKTSYTLKALLLNSKLILTLYNKMGYITNINDYDLKFNNIKGYISSFTLDLDDPSQDEIEIKNYKTKFLDLFSTITAQTEAMKKNSYTLLLANAAFTSSGDISSDVLQSSIMKVDLNYAFNNGKLTIDEKNGIWGTSDNGVVAFRGGGIFTATEKDTDDNWKWNTGITPEGINADLITSGQLDTNLIKIYAGDQLRFQMNGDGIFAYKSRFDEPVTLSENSELNTTLIAENSIDAKQYVLFNENGLSLIAKKGAKVLSKDRTQYYLILNEDLIRSRLLLANLTLISRVEISWDGLILRNWLNLLTFFADAETGNLTLKGRIEATSGHIGTWRFDNNKMWSAGGIDAETKTYKTYVVLNAGGYADGDVLMDDNEQPIYIDSLGDPILVTTKDYCFWAGSPKPTDASFSVKKDGQINASAGMIGGWTISSNYLTSKNVTLIGNATSFEDLSSSELYFGSGTNNDLESEDTVTQAITGSSSLPQTIIPIIFSHPSTNTNLNLATFIVASDGKVLAQDFYILNYYNNKIESWKSITSWISAVETSVTNAYNKAVSALSTARGRVLDIKYEGDTLYYCYKTGDWGAVPVY